MTEATTEYRPRFTNVPSSTVSFNISEALHTLMHSMALGEGISDSELIRRAIHAYIHANSGFASMEQDITRVNKGAIWNEYQPTPEERARSKRYIRMANSKVGRRVKAYFTLMEKCPDLTGLDKPQRKPRAKDSEKVKAVVKPVEDLKPVETLEPVEKPAPYVNPEIPVLPMSEACAKYPDEAVLEEVRYEGKRVMEWFLKPVVYLSQRWFDSLLPYPEVDTPLAKQMLALMDGIATLDYKVIEQRAAQCQRLGNEWKITPIEKELSLVIYINMMDYVNELYVQPLE